MGVNWYTCSVCGQVTSDYQDVSCGNEECEHSYCYECAKELASIFGKAKDYSENNPRPKKCWDCAIDKDKEIKKLENKEKKYQQKIYEIKKQIKAHIIKTYKENEKSSSKDDEKQSDKIDSKRQQ